MCIGFLISNSFRLIIMAISQSPNWGISVLEKINDPRKTNFSMDSKPVFFKYLMIFSQNRSAIIGIKGYLKEHF